MIVQMLCSDTLLYLCFNRQWIFLTVWIGTQKGMHVLHVCLLSWTIFWNYHWTLKEKVRKFQLLNYVIRVSLISNDSVNIMKEKFVSHLCLLYFCSLGKGTPKKKMNRGARHKFWKEPLRGTEILLCGCGLKCFSPLRGTNSKTTHYLLSRSAQYPIRYHKSSHCGPVEAEHPER